MPKGWDAIRARRRAVREAILDTAGSLVLEYGPRGVTMSRVAGDTGIGRATLYKHFPDIESILIAWHERTVADHLLDLTDIRDREDGACARLEAVLESVAVRHYEHRTSNLAAVLHRGDQPAGHGAGHLHHFLEEIIRDGAKCGALRDDIPAAELASYCKHALAAASGVASPADIRKLVTVIVAALRPLV